MSTVSVRDSRKDLISVDSEKGGGESPTSSNGGLDKTSPGEMTTFNRSSSHRLLSAALVLSLALCVGLLVGLIVVSTRTSDVGMLKNDGHRMAAPKVAPVITKDNLCLSEGCIGKDSEFKLEIIFSTSLITSNYFLFMNIFMHTIP